MSTDAGPQIANNIVMPVFPLQLGQMLAQCTGYNEIDVLEPGSVFFREEMSDSEITDRVFHLCDQIFTLVYDEREATTEMWGRLSVFSLKLDLHFIHQFLEANEGRNHTALVMIAKEARARILLQEMAHFGVLHLISTDFIVYRDSVEFVSVILNYVTTDWREHQKHLKNDPEHVPFHSDADRTYVERVLPLWTSFLQLPMFQVKVETLGAPWSGIH